MKDFKTLLSKTGLFLLYILTELLIFIFTIGSLSAAGSFLITTLLLIVPLITLSITYYLPIKDFNRKHKILLSITTFLITTYIIFNLINPSYGSHSFLDLSDLINFIISLIAVLFIFSPLSYVYISLIYERRSKNPLK